MFVYLIRARGSGVGDVLTSVFPGRDFRGWARREVNHPEFGECTLMWRGEQIMGYDSGMHWTDYPEKRFGIGWDVLPKPEELAREKQYEGHMVKLGDGNEWLVPVARYCNGQPMESTYRIGTDGELREEVSDRCRELYEFGCRFWDGLYGAAEKGAGEFTYEVKDQFEMAARILGYNYDVTRWEVSALGLITDQTLRELMNAVVDVPRVIRIMQEKKTNGEPKGSSSSSGGGDS